MKKTLFVVCPILIAIAAFMVMAKPGDSPTALPGIQKWEYAMLDETEVSEALFLPEKKGDPQHEPVHFLGIAKDGKSAFEQLGKAWLGKSVTLPEFLNKLGAEGWELVCVVQTKAGSTDWFFKRRI